MGKLELWGCRSFYFQTAEHSGQGKTWFIRPSNDDGRSAGGPQGGKWDP